jgi:hypothetical protein
MTTGWSGPFYTGGKLDKPATGDNGIARWWAEENGENLFFSQCRHIGKVVDDTAECLGKITGLELVDPK